jgi:hypothetical protein
MIAAFSSLATFSTDLLRSDAGESLTCSDQALVEALHDTIGHTLYIGGAVGAIRRFRAL